MFNDRLLRVLRGEPVDKTPVWIMRQAGRYLPEYRTVRSQAGSFMQLCKQPELAAEVTLQPLRRFDLDAAIVFSDILVIPDAMGLELYFEEGEGPRFKKPMNSVTSVERLTVPVVTSELSYVADTIRLLKQELTVPLIGFAGSPWTVATYMVEGGTSKNFSKIKQWRYQTPAVLHELLALLTQTTIDYLRMQVAAGVDVVMVFDTWGGALSATDYQEFSLAYMAKIVNALQTDVPVILFTKNGGLWLSSTANTGCAAVGVDWTITMTEARQRAGDRVVLQGNLDPAALYATPDVVKAHVAQLLAQVGPHGRHIMNLGHGIYPDIDPGRVKVFVDSVHELSEIYHAKQHN